MLERPASSLIAVVDFEAKFSSSDRRSLIGDDVSCVGFQASNLHAAVFLRRVVVPGAHQAATWQLATIRHSGWMGSVLIASVANMICRTFGIPKFSAVWIVALEALYSDLISPKVICCCSISCMIIIASPMMSRHRRRCCC